MSSQWVVTVKPFNNSASAKIKAPVQTDATFLDLSATLETQDITFDFFISSVCIPPTTMSTSISGCKSKQKCELIAEKLFAWPQWTSRI